MLRSISRLVTESNSVARWACDTADAAPLMSRMTVLVRQSMAAVSSTSSPHHGGGGGATGSEPTDEELAQQEELLRELQGEQLSAEVNQGVFFILRSISVTFSDEKDGSVQTVNVPLGQSLLEAAHANDIDLEGACEGSLACSTCHVIIEDPDMFDRIPEPCDDENDMLDLAFGLTDTSRLGCQVKATPELEGMKVRIPAATRNFAVDGFVPKPH